MVNLGQKLTGLVLGSVGVALLPMWAHAQCTPEWHNELLPGVSGAVYTSVMFDDDGAGPRPPMLYIGGNFWLAGGQRAVGVARWNGAMWEQVGAGFYSSASSPGLGTVRSLVVFNGELHAGGRFSRIGQAGVDNIAKWNGTEWQGLGPGGVVTTECCQAPQIDALVVHDDGQGAALYLTGNFELAGSEPANAIAKWNGTSYSSLGIPEFNGLYGNGGPWGRALASYQGALYVGGDFSSAMAVPNTGRLAKWSGGAWSSVGSVDDRVFALHVFDDDGAGPHSPVLVAGGDIQRVGVGLGGSPGVNALGVAAWNGTSWSGFGTGLVWWGQDLRSAEILSLGSFDGGNGPRLYAGGAFVAASPNGTASALHRWNGTAWEIPGPQPMHLGAGVLSLGMHDVDGAGPQGASLVVGGSFNGAGSVAMVNIGKFDGAAWSPMPEGGASWTSGGSALNTGIISELAAGDEDGAGPRPPAVYTFGTFDAVGGVAMNSRIARLDGDAWTPLGAGPGFKVRRIVFYDDGTTGTRLYAIANEGALSRWDGTNWTSVASINASVIRSATVFDADGAGPQRAAIYASGEFLNPDETEFVTAVVKWDGTSATWSPVTSTTPGGLDPRRFVYVLLPYDGRLYAGGGFVNGAGTSLYGLGSYDGTDWTMAGETSGVSQSVKSLAVFQGLLYVGGEFPSIGTATSPGLASWNGSAWANVGSGVTGAFPVAYPYVNALGVGDDGAGVGLFVGGKFETAGGVAGTRSIAKWNGASFTQLAGGVRSNSIAAPDFPELGVLEFTPNGGIDSIAALGNKVYMTGTFNRAGSEITFNLAAWGCEAPSCIADFNHSGAVSVQDIFDFLSAYFMQLPSADVNGAGGVSVQDIFDYLAAYFVGC